MGAVELRHWGGTAPAAPIIKRAVGHLTTNQAVMIVPDTNIPSALGGNVVDGLSKIYVYVSTDANRTAWTVAVYTPPVDVAQYGRSAVCSMTVRSNNDILIAWQGVDNSLHVTRGAWTGSTFTFSDTVVVAAGAITNRFRAIDIDDCWPQKSVAVACYEAAAASGQGAYARVYIRKDDETTWVMAYETQFFTSQFIQAGTEDISIAWNAAGVVSNLNQLALFYTRSHTTGDLGDRVVELQVNVNTATTNSATTVGTWFSILHQNIAASTGRKGWLFSEASGVWMFATAVGSSNPFFMSCRLYHNQFTDIVINKTPSNVFRRVVSSGATEVGGVPYIGNPSNIVVRKDNFGPGAVAVSYMDNTVIFGYSGYGVEKPYAARSIVMAYSNTTVKQAKSIDTAPRMLDGGYNLTDGVIGIYGGDNHSLAESDRQYNFMSIYGRGGFTLPSLWLDMFDRPAVTNGWGLSTSGQTWSPPANAADFSTNGNQGVIVLTAANSSRIIPLPGTSVADGDIVADFSTSVLMTGAFSRFSLVARYQGTNDFIYASFEPMETQAVRVALHKRVGGTDTQLGASFVVAGLTHAINARLRLKFTFVGTTLSAKIWDPNGGEPVNPQFTQTDGTLPTAAGTTGVRALRSVSNTNANLNVFVEHYAVYPANTSVNPSQSLRRARAIYEDALVAPVVLSPSNSIVGINSATLRIQYQGVNLYSSVKGAPQYQLATNSAFSVNVRAPFDSNSSMDPSSANGKVPPIKVFTYTLTGADALFPGTWFFRARMLSDLGGVAGPYSPSVSFTVSHPPAVTPKNPKQGTSILYVGAGTVTFSWDSSDTEPTDTQSAYQVIVVRVDTGAVVWDSGKVVSSVKLATNNFSSTLKDIPLQWTVSLWDSFDSKGPSSTPVLFTVVDPPSVSVTSPTSGAVLATARPTVAWSFTVGGTRTQKAYRVQLADTDTVPETTLADTGWLMGTNNSYTFPTNVLSESDTNAFTDGFELGIGAWGGAVGGTFVQSSAHARTGSQAGLLTVTGTPTQTYVRNSFANRFPVIPGRTYKLGLWVFAESALANVPGVIDWQDSNGTYLSSSTTGGSQPLAAGAWESRGFSAVAPANAAYAVFGPTIGSSPATGSQVWFDDVSFDAINYRVDVSVQDNVGLQATSSVLFSTDWVSPAQAVPTVFSDPFKFTVQWTNAAQDPDFAGWRVYRRYQRPVDASLDVMKTAVLWEMVYETTDVMTNYSFNDYMAPLNKNVDYCVVQVADRFGSLVESRITSFVTRSQAGDRYYFVPEVPIGVIAAFEAANVTADGFTKEIEQATLHVKGRGRQQQIGDDLGYTGTLTVKLRNPTTARRDREFFEFLSGDDAGNVWLRSPFGDVLYVAFGNIQTNRIPGMGLGDMVDLTIPYFEVFQELPITRLS